ncbi:MAG: hypothetical protein ACRDSP_17980 [Pseudonocardiaceae bacterium]
MTCPHSGKVTFVPASPPRVTVSGTPVVTALDQMVVAGCTFTPPCVKVQWINVSARAVVNGQPIVLQTPPTPPPAPGNGTCAPTPAPPLVLAMQVRAMGT